MKPTLKPPGTKHLKLKCDILLSTSAFKFNLRRYNREDAAAQKLACHELCCMTLGNDENRTRAAAAGAVEAVVAAMRAHPRSEGVQHRACDALGHMTFRNADNQTRAGNAGALIAVVAAMRQAAVALAAVHDAEAEADSEAERRGSPSGGRFRFVPLGVGGYIAARGISEALRREARLGGNPIRNNPNSRSGAEGDPQRERVPQWACAALGAMTRGNAEERTRAGNAGAVVGRCRLTLSNPS